MIPYREGDTITVRTEDGSVAAYRVVSNVPGVEWQSLTLQPLPAAPDPEPSLPLAAALAATSGPDASVEVLTPILGQYFVKGVNTGSGLIGLVVDHHPCTWYGLVSTRLECSLPHLLALALEHRIAGCKVPR